MRPWHLSARYVAALATALSATAFTQNPPAGAQIQGGAGVAAGVAFAPPAELRAEAIRDVVHAGEKVELLSADVKSGDGIIGMRDESALFIELGVGNIWRIAPDGQFSSVAARKGTKAIGANRDGHVIALLQDSLEIIYPADKARVLAAGTEGHSLRGLNDFVVSSKGDIYATDVGTYNQPKYSVPTKIHYIPSGGTPRVAAETRDFLALPNGIVLSPDEKTLYVADSRNNSGMAWDVRTDGSLANGRAFARSRITEAMDRDFTLQANGLAIDADGRLYVAMPLGVQVFSPGGVYLGTIPAGLKIQSVSFAGPNKQYLYMLAQRAVWRVKTIAHGHMPRAK
jgi:gluconolactonase